MKKLLLVVSIFSALNYSCSKKDQSEVAVPPHLTEYPIDLNYTIRPRCSISTDFTSYLYPDKKDFHFFAASNSSLPDDTSGSYINISQTYLDYDLSYSDPQFIISANRQNGNDYFGIKPESSDFNLFKLPYQNGFASFSGTCQVAPAPFSVKYHNISSLKTQPLTYSGFFDIVNDTGSIRIKGSLYLQQ